MFEEPSNFDYLEESYYFDFPEECPIASFESKRSFESKHSFEHEQNNCESWDSEINIHFDYQRLENESDIDHHFKYQLLEDEPNNDSIKSSEIAGRLCDQFHWSNVSLSRCEEACLNANRDNEETEDINPQSTFEHPLVEPPSKLDIKPSPVKEDLSSERKKFGGTSKRDFENLKSNQYLQPSIPNKGKNESTNLTTHSTASKEESKPSTSKVTFSHSSHSKVVSNLVVSP